MSGLMGLLLCVLAVASFPALGMQAGVASAQVEEPTPATAPTARMPEPTSAAPPEPEDTASAALQAQLEASEARLRQAIKESEPNWLEKLWPAILGLIGVFVGGAINVWLQGRQRTSADRAHQANAAFEAQSQIMAYRSRQAHEFYYPLLLSLQRSSGVRRQLLDHLNTKNPSRFQFEREDGPDGREHLFVHDPACVEPAPFRLIERMHELASAHRECLPMVQEIVAIGEKMSALIHDKGGLVLSSSTQLTKCLGQYLAHFSILREVTEKAVTSAALQQVRYNVVYPREGSPPI